MSPISVTDYHVHISNHERLKKTFQLQTPLVLICFFFPEIGTDKFSSQTTEQRFAYCS
jgi:hypothetical protein